MTEIETETLGDELLKELIRARGLVEQYVELRGTKGVYVEFAIEAINRKITATEKSMCEGDAFAMLEALNALKECE